VSGDGLRLSLLVRGQKSDAGHDEILLNGKVGTSVTTRRWPSSKLDTLHGDHSTFVVLAGIGILIIIVLVLPVILVTVIGLGLLCSCICWINPRRLPESGKRTRYSLFGCKFANDVVDMRHTLGNPDAGKILWLIY
jgi:hypothetical protein